MSGKCKNCIVGVQGVCGMKLNECPIRPAHKPEPSAGQVGSSDLLVPATPAPTATPDRFTAGPIGARDEVIIKPGGEYAIFLKVKGNCSPETKKALVEALLIAARTL